MSGANPPPTLAGFLSFIRSVMNISTAVLPDATVAIQWAFSVALMTVNQQLAGIGGGGASFGTPQVDAYTLAVYNLAGDNLINYAPDVQPPVVYKNSLPYFAYLRQQWNINGFVAGVVQSSADVTTSDSLAVPDALKQLSIAQLQNLKTPWGRRYLALAQGAGTLWGVS